jgi:hypothetical protein
MDEDEFYEPLRMEDRLTIAGVFSLAMVVGLMLLMLIGLGFGL